MSEHEADIDPEEIDRRAAERAPVEEAGGGVAEGFEQAEEDLIENAEHGEGAADPAVDAFPPEGEASEPRTAYGEADDARSSSARDQQDEPD
jgi:hypothetical protein